jgi:hypothetical protein
MKLSYRGAQYDAQLPEVPSDGIETIGTYRGAPAKRRHFLPQRAHHYQAEMTYRGVKYTQSM